MINNGELLSKEVRCLMNLKHLEMEFTPNFSAELFTFSTKDFWHKNTAPILLLQIIQVVSAVGRS